MKFLGWIMRKNFLSYHHRSVNLIQRPDETAASSGLSPGIFGAHRHRDGVFPPLGFFWGKFYLAIASKSSLEFLNFVLPGRQTAAAPGSQESEALGTSPRA